MKRVIIGGFLAIIGTIMTLPVVIIASNNMASSWSTPPGRFLTTVLQMGMSGIFIIACILVILGVAIMGIEYFKADK